MYPKLKQLLILNNSDHIRPPHTYDLLFLCTFKAWLQSEQGMTLGKGSQQNYALFHPWKMAGGKEKETGK